MVAPALSSAPRAARAPARTWLRLAVTGACLALVLWVAPWGSLRESLTALEAPTWLTAFAGLLAGHALGAWKWRFVLGLGRARLTHLDALECYAAGFFSNLFLPSIVGGDALKAILAGRKTGRYETAVLGGATERLIDTAALLCLIVGGAVATRGTVQGWAQSVIQVALLVGLGGLVLCFPLLLRRPLARWPARIRRIVGRSLVVVRRLVRRPYLALFVLALSLLIQAWFVMLNALLAQGIGIHAPLAVWFFAVPLTKAITLAPVSLGGFGLREVTLGSFLFLLAGVPEARGVAASLLWQSVVVALALLCGLLWLALSLRPRGGPASRG